MIDCKCNAYQHSLVGAIKKIYELVNNQTIELNYLYPKRKSTQLPTFFSQEEVRKILNATENLKHKAILTTIYSCGLRLSELINLKLTDVKSDSNLLLIQQSKGNKDRLVALPDKLLSLLREYYIEYKPKIFLFEGTNDEQYSERSIWELYLFCFFKEQKFDFHREHEAPDYLVEKFEQKLAVEAVVISRKDKDFKVKDFKTADEMNQALENKIPLMVSNAIYEKVKKKYWKKDHIKGIPFILAVADFHETSSMIWTYEAFLTALYGVKPRVAKKEDGIHYQAIDTIGKFTKENGTEIPAGQFFQKEYENVSAILYNPTATISKFNRMGRQAGLGTHQSQLFWKAAYHDHTPGALIPKIRTHEITESCHENWSMGATIFHNPNAKLPVDPNLFNRQVAHVFMENDKLLNLVPDVHPYQGWVINNIKFKKK